MPPTSNAPAKLIRLLEYHERAAAAIRTVIEMLDADARGSSSSRASTTINAAIGIDAMRHAAQSANGNGHGPRGPYKKRAATHAPAAAPHAKPHAKPHATGAGSAKSVKARRTASARYLAKFDTNEPRDAFKVAKQAGFEFRGLGPLVRRGYLEKSGDGYVRTQKEFVV